MAHKDIDAAVESAMHQATKQDWPDPELYCNACEWAGVPKELDQGGVCPACGEEALEEI